MKAGSGIGSWPEQAGRQARNQALVRAFELLWILTHPMREVGIHGHGKPAAARTSGHASPSANEAAGTYGATGTGGSGRARDWWPLAADGRRAPRPMWPTRVL